MGFLYDITDSDFKKEFEEIDEEFGAEDSYELRWNMAPIKNDMGESGNGNAEEHSLLAMEASWR